MTLQVPCEDKFFHQALFPPVVPSKQPLLKEKTGKNDCHELSVKATLFDKETLKSLLNEKTNDQRNEYEKENNFSAGSDYEYNIFNIATKFRSKRLQNKKDKKEKEKVRLVESENDKLQREALSKKDKDQAHELLEKNHIDKREDKIEGLFSYTM